VLDASFEFDGLLDLHGTLLPLGMPFRDPTLRIRATEAARATRTPEGPATLHAEIVEPGRVRVRCFGPGAAWSMARARALLGLDDPGYELPSQAPAALRNLGHRAQGIRLARTERVFELLVVIVLEQLVSGAEASRAYANLVREYSTHAPGPVEDLWLPLGPEEVLAIPAAAFPALGALARQGAALHELARRAARVEEAAAMTFEDAARRLLAFPGVGPWTALSAMLRGMGFADAVPLGDYHLPHLVAFHLAGEPRADDERMLALLAPYAGQRGRVVRWIARAGSLPPRRGPRMALREVPAEGRSLARSLRPS
jgi:3-methyladenine DNA glycosylase/8-oxoguanine DNA glycosylase